MILASSDGIGISRLVAGNGTLAVRAGAAGASLGTLFAGGPIDVSAGGSVTIDNAVSRTSVSVTSTDGNVTLAAGSTLLTTQPPSALASPAVPPSDGGISLNVGGTVTLTGPVTARGALLVNAGGIARFQSTATGATIDVTSTDLDIGQSAVVGGGAATGLVRFTARPGIRSFIGGTGAGAPAGSYVVTDAELDRVRAAQIILASGVVSSDPARAPDVTVDTLSLTRADASGNGNFFGPAGLFRVETPGTIRIIAPLSFTNLTDADRVEFVGRQQIEAIAPAANVSLRGSGTQPAGTLLFESDRIVVATEAAAQDVRSLNTVDGRSRRLGQTDGANQPLGYLQANALAFRVGSVLYIQNSNGNTADSRSGFTVGPGGVTVTQLAGAGTAEVIINGRIVDGAGNPDQTGRALLPTVVPFAAGSSANGCTTFAALCSDASDLLGRTTGLAATNGGNLDEQVDEEEREQATFRPRVPALIEVKGLSAPSLPSVIEAPVTGAGNDDLWVDTGPGLSDRSTPGN
jgi:hypothetical protein